MKFTEVLRIIRQEPVFHSSLLLAGQTDPLNVQKQLSRWARSGKILQLRRGLYALAPPYRKVEPHPFFVANRLVPHSYVSLQSALAYYGMIPEFVVEITSVTTGRPEKIENPLGRFSFRHLKGQIFTGFTYHEVVKDQYIFIATPAKALLDLMYFSRYPQVQPFVEQLRLQNLGQINRQELIRLGSDFNSKKMDTALQAILSQLEAGEEDKTL